MEWKEVDNVWTWNEKSLEWEEKKVERIQDAVGKTDIERE